MVINLIFVIIFVPDLESPTSSWFYFRLLLKNKIKIIIEMK